MTGGKGGRLEREDGKSLGGVGGATGSSSPGSSGGGSCNTVALCFLQA